VGWTLEKNSVRAEDLRQKAADGRHSRSGVDWATKKEPEGRGGSDTSQVGRRGSITSKRKNMVEKEIPTGKRGSERKAQSVKGEKPAGGGITVQSLKDYMEDWGNVSARV